MIQAGRLRHRVTIQQPTVSRGSTGEEVATWSTLAERWAEVQPLSGKEPYVAGIQVQGELLHRIRLRYDDTIAAVTPKMRILYGTRTFDIQHILNIGERDREVHILGEEIV